MDTTVDLAVQFEQPITTTDAFNQLACAAFSTNETLHRFIELLNELEDKTERGEGDTAASSLKLGLAYLYMGDAPKALAWLGQATEGVVRRLAAGRANLESRRFAEALAEFDKAAALGANRLEIDCLRAECLAQMGNFDDALRALKQHASHEAGSAMWNYARGRIYQEQGELQQAAASYKKAVDIDPANAHARFYLAYLCDLFGDDEEAMNHYIHCTGLPLVHMHALINLAVIHEDNNEYDLAEECLRRVLAVNPNHERARLYLRDVLAADTMYINEHQVRAMEKRSAVLDTPITDFELSVRSRNCLKKMNLNTLGDLLRITEAELLAYKNFGETSLREIKAMLAQKGLSLGQNSPMGGAARPAPDFAALAPNVSPDVLSRPVMSIELSVRSRKCLQRLGISTIGELIIRSEQELLESRNFGQTSLTEIKACLAQMGLSLRQA